LVAIHPFLVEEGELCYTECLATAVAWIDDFDPFRRGDSTVGKVDAVSSELELIQRSPHLLWSSKTIQGTACFCGHEVRVRVEVADDLVEELRWQAGERHTITKLIRWKSERKRYITYCAKKRK
jgi:hypothetical protein